MKKVLFFALCALTAGTASAQISKGQWLAGGNLSFSTSKYGDIDASQTTTFQFAPNAGYFFMDNLAAGLRVSLTSSKQKEDRDAYSQVLVAPFARYYFLPSGEKLNVFADAGFGLGSAGSSNKEGFNQFFISAGPSFFLTSNVAVEMAVGFTSNGGEAYKMPVTGDEKRLNTLGLNVGFQIHL